MMPVEPPADVAATPDPRLDVVERLGVIPTSTAQRILDALDAMRPEERAHERIRPVDSTRKVYLQGWEEGRRAGLNERGPLPAPTGLSAAQEIRRWIEFGADIATKAIHVTGMVEHGDDETPDLNRLRDAESRVEGLTLAHAFWKERAEQAEARADLAEARLGQVAEALRVALRDYSPGDHGIREAVKDALDALAWTPDDTATAGAATGDGDGD